MEFSRPTVRQIEYFVAVMHRRTGVATSLGSGS